MTESIRRSLAQGRLVVGCNSLLSDPAVSELIAFAGNDFVWIDMEHAALDNKDVELHIMAAHSGGAAALVRVPLNDQVMVKRIADMGPDGIIFPFVKTAEDVREAIASCRYHFSAIIPEPAARGCRFTGKVESFSEEEKKC